MSSSNSGLKISLMESRGGGVDFATFVILSLDGRNGHNKKARPGAIIALETDPEAARLLRFPWGDTSAKEKKAAGRLFAVVNLGS
jgi:hypothetical protein